MSFHTIRPQRPALGTHRVTNPLIEPISWEFPVIVLLAILLFASDVLEWRAEETMNYVAPVCLSLALGVSAVKMALADSRAIWAPLFWFRVATVVYFGVGSVVPLVTNSATRLYLEAFYAFLSAEIQQVNLVVAVGVACILGSNLIFERLSRRDEHAVSRSQEIRVSNNALHLGIGMYLIGFIVKYLLILPSERGLIPIVIPGFVVNLTTLQLVGVSLLTIWGLSNARLSLFGVVLLVIFDSAMGVLMLSKTAAMYPLLAFVIGALSHRLTIRRLALAALFLWFTFDFLQPWVAYARGEQARAYRGSIVDFSDVAKIYASYFDSRKTLDSSQAIQQSLVRVSMVSVGAFVIAQYDRGHPGNSLEDAVYSFVPRFLWPEKPVIQVAAELSTLATGEVGNSVSAGYFAESYWNFGWIGLPMLLCPVGIFFNLATHFAGRVIERKDWLYLPILFLNLKVALLVDAWYVGFVGTIAQGLALYVVLRIVGHGLRSAGLMAAPSNSKG